MRDAHVEQLTTLLQDQRIKVERVAQTLNVSMGQGLTAVKANLDLGAILERLEGMPLTQAEAHRLMSGFVQGVKTTLSEPKKSRASQWSYELTAGRMMLSIEVDTFLLGAKAVSPNEDPWHTKFAQDLVLITVIELDRGLRPLMQQQVDQWGATNDRIFSAARSMLFHKTRNTSIKTHPDNDAVSMIRVGDGYDAARGLVASDVFFSDIEESKFVFSIPHQDTLLFIQDQANLDALEAVATQEFQTSSYPLSTSPLQLEPVGRPPKARTIS